MAKLDYIYGLHSLTSVLSTEPERVLELFILKGRADDRLNTIINLARKYRISIQFCPRKTLDDMVSNEQHQGVVARAKPARVLDESDLDKILAEHSQPMLLVLDGVTDPHNIGACLRTADGAGACEIPPVGSGYDRLHLLRRLAQRAGRGAGTRMPRERE